MAGNILANNFEYLAGAHLELHLMDVDRVRVLSEVIYSPDLDRTEHRVLSDGVVPISRDGVACSVERA